MKKSKKNDRNNKQGTMIILGIETSCDDTGISILKARENKTPDFEILTNKISSQIEIHKKYGGVYPTMARREHEKNLTPVLEKALKEAKLLKSKIQIIPNYSKSNPKSKIQNYDLKLKTLEKIFDREPELLKNLEKFLEKYEKPKIDAIAVTVGPGLDPCLWTGVNFAKALSYYWNIPIIPVNHIEAHILVNYIPPQRDPARGGTKKIKFPAICLVVSGGHTQLISMKGIGKYKILGETRDDAAGECFDKTARILGLEYPGGPNIAMEAKKFKIDRCPTPVIDRCPTPVNLPRPMIYSKDYDFSFSGLKTAVLYDFKKRSPKIQKSSDYIQAMCAEIQQSIIDVLIKKTLRAAQDYKAKTIILGGGVCANEELREQFEIASLPCGLARNDNGILRLRAQNDRSGTPRDDKGGKNQLNILIPVKNLCTDNGLMTAITGYFHRNKQTKNWKNVKVNANLRIDDESI